ncbi:MAG: GLUG motif-containing protein [Clostridia bacterium]|nr:GLUG motif-containing protein [Clostridia bacterium]
MKTFKHYFMVLAVIMVLLLIAALSVSCIVRPSPKSFLLTITSSDTELGSVSGGGMYKGGETVTISASPSDGYDLGGWFIDEALQSEEIEYSFIMPYHAVDIVARFEKEAQWSLWDGTVADSFAGGNGTKEAPYIISSGAELKLLANKVKDVDTEYNASGVCYELKSNLDLNGLEWDPIGKFYSDTGEFVSNLTFLGNFNGNGYVIRNFIISTSPIEKCRYFGLFGYIERSEISKLGVEDFSIDLTANTALVGGLCGYGYKSSIKDCYTSGNITVNSNGYTYVGALCGETSSSTIENCLSFGNVCATSTEKTIYIGGLIGQCDTTDVKNCFSAAKTSSASSIELINIGALIGCGSDVENSFYPEFSFCAGIGKIVEAEQLSNTSWYTDVLELDRSVWSINNGYYPRLQKAKQNKQAVQTACEEGSIGNPIILRTANELQSINPWKSYSLCCNLDLIGIDWTPINSFSNFYGNGYVIYNVKIDSNNSADIGLFARSCGSIDSLGVSNVDISATSDLTYINVGGLCGYSNMLTNCFASAVNISVDASAAKGLSVGGLCGQSNIITKCYSDGQVSANNTFDYKYSSIYIGGLCGQTDESVVLDSFSSVDITAYSIKCSIYAGGLLARGSALSCYATGNITTQNSKEIELGTLIGFADSIKDCFATGNITVSDSTISTEISAMCAFGTSVSNVYFPEFGYLAGYGKIATCAELSNPSWQENVLQFNAQAWEYKSGFYPRLIGTNSDWKAVPTQCELGSIGNPVEIINFVELKSINPFTSYSLGCNINLSSEFWTPLFYCSYFYGNGYTLSDLKIKEANSKYIGFFSINNGTIDSLNIDGLKIIVDNDNETFIGGMCGYGKSFTNCHVSRGVVTLSMTGGTPYVGGFCGRSQATVLNCSYSGTVYGDTVGPYDDIYVGGLVGINHRGTVTNCYFLGTVKGSAGFNAMVGGICGENTGLVANCYSDSEIFATSSNRNAYAGGISGYNCRGGIINNCYANGKINSTAKSYSTSGGVSGYNDDSTITNCYFNGEVYSKDSLYNFAGGVCGYNDFSYISNCFAIGTVCAESNVDNCYAYASGVCCFNEEGTIKDCYHSQEQIITAKNGENEGTISSYATAITSEELMSESFITETLKWGKFVSTADVEVNPDNAWIYEIGKYPILYFMFN